MKKIKVMIVFMMLLFTLSGCEFLDNQDVDVDPVKVDLLDSILTSDMALEDVVKKLYEVMDQDSAVCATLFAPDSELLKTCEEDFSKLLPESLDNLLVLEEDVLINFDGENKITYMNSNKGVGYEILLSFSLVNEQVYISGLSFNELELHSATEVLLAFSEMLSDYSDASLTTVEYCKEYYSEDDQFSCIYFRNREIRYGYEYKVSNMYVIDTNVYLFVYDTVVENGLVISTRYDYVEVIDSDELTLVVLDKSDYETTFTVDELKDIMNKAIDVMRQDGYTQEKFDEVFPNSSPDLIMLSSLVGSADSVTIQSASILENGQYHLEIVLVTSEKSCEVSLLFDYQSAIDTYSFKITNVSDQSFVNDVVVSDFVEKFNDTNWNIDYIVSEYTYGDFIPYELLQMRGKGYAIEDYTLILTDPYSSFPEYSLVVNIGGKQIDYIVHFTNQYNKTVIMFENDSNVSKEGQPKELITEFFASLTENEHFSCSDYVTDSSLEFCEKYFIYSPEMEYRVDYVFENLNYNKAYISYGAYHSGSETSDLDFVIVSEGDDYLIHFVNTKDDEIYAYLFANVMVDLINDESTVAEKLDILFSIGSHNLMKPVLEMIAETGSVELEFVNYEFLNQYLVLNVLDSNDEVVSSLMIDYAFEGLQSSPKYQVSKVETIDLLGVDDEDVYMNFVNEFTSNFNNGSLSTNEFCTMYGDLLIDCYGFRDAFLEMGNNLQFENVSVSSRGALIIEVSIIKGDDHIGQIELPMIIYVDVDGFVTAREVYQPFFDPIKPATPLDYDLINTTIESFLNDLIDDTLSLDYLKETYGENFVEFYSQRDSFTGFNSVSVDVLSSGGRYDIEVTYGNDEGETVIVPYSVRVYSQEDYRVDYIDNGAEYDLYMITLAELLDGLNGVTDPSEKVLALTTSYYSTQGDKLYDFIRDNNLHVEVEISDDRYYGITVYGENDVELYRMNYAHNIEFDLLGNPIQSIILRDFTDVNIEKVIEYVKIGRAHV